jgi:hypothetical protein
MCQTSVVGPERLKKGLPIVWSKTGSIEMMRFPGSRIESLEELI